MQLLVNLLLFVTELDGVVVRRTWELLIQASVERRSLEHVVRHAPGSPSPTAVRKAVATVLLRFSLPLWEDRLNEALRQRWLSLLLKQAQVSLVGDETSLPYWGRREGELKAEVRGGSPKLGTTWFFTYVTVCALWRGQRIVLGVTRWRAHESLADALERLGAPLLAAGLRVDTWLYDRGGASVAAFGWWQDRNQPFIVAAPRRGDKTGVAAILKAAEAEEGRSTRRPSPRGQWYTLHPDKRSGLAPRTVWLAIAWEPVKKTGRRERRQRGLKRSRVKAGQRWRAVAYFTDGGDWRGRGGAVQAKYRKRQSIESSYRQSHASRGRTCSRDPRLRLVLFGLSMLMENEWAWYRRGKARATRGGRRKKPAWRFIDYCQEVMEEGLVGLRDGVEGWWPGIRRLERLQLPTRLTAAGAGV
jgi:hypothetical protein